jgi:hypothetical protein
MNVSPESVRVNGVVLGFLFRSGSAWGGDHESVWHG